MSSLIALRCTWRYWCRCLVTSVACDGPSSVPSVSVMKWFLLKPFAFHCSSVSYESPWESVDARELSLPLKICCQDSKPEGEDWPWLLGPWQWNLGDSTFCVTEGGGGGGGGGEWPRPQARVFTVGEQYSCLRRTSVTPCSLVHTHLTTHQLLTVQHRAITTGMVSIAQ